jgi:acyl-CoA thioester hydrolase
MPFTHETSFHVRYAETDESGVAHHSTYLVWFEEGRSSFLRALGSGYDQFVEMGLYLPVVEAQVQYRAPAIYNQLITVRVWIAEVKSRAMTFSAEVVDAQSRQILAQGHTRHICTDHEGHARRVPESWRQLVHSGS